MNTVIRFPKPQVACSIHAGGANETSGVVLFRRCNPTCWTINDLASEWLEHLNFCGLT